MTAQYIFKEKGYSVSDNRSLNWRNINKAIDFGIIPFVTPVGKVRKLKNGFEWKLALQFKKQDGTWFKRYYKMDGIENFVCGKWQTTGQDVVSHLLISAISNFRNVLINEGLFDVSISVAKENGMPVCDKCRGKGIIPSFMHYCKGVCFDCMGLGYGNQGKNN